MSGSGSTLIAKPMQLGPRRSFAARAHSIEMGHAWATAELIGISHYSYVIEIIGGCARTRTLDPLIKRQLFQPADPRGNRYCSLARAGQNGTYSTSSQCY